MQNDDKGLRLKEYSDESLMKEYAKGSFVAFEHLYARHKNPLYRYLMRQLKQASVADDVCQEVWSKVISSASDYQDSAKFTTWLYTIARHKVIDYARHAKIVEKHSSELTEQSADAEATSSLFSSAGRASPQQAHQHFLKRQAIEHCLASLPPHQLECFLLKEEGGMSTNEIAKVITAGVEATKSRLRSAYKNLRQCLSIKLEGKAWLHSHASNMHSASPEAKHE